MDKLNFETAKALHDEGILKFKGFSGIDVDVETASQAPSICQAHAMSGNVYDLQFDGDSFTLVPFKIVYEVK